MEEENNKMQNLQQKSHEALLKCLNNIGIIGSIIAALADLVFMVIYVIGVHINMKQNTILTYSLLNAFIGVTINILMRYQGRHYAEIENKELLEQYNSDKVKKQKKYISMAKWELFSAIKDIVVKGTSIVFSLYAVIKISIDGSKNPIQILITLGILLLFACFGLINMNSAYNRYYNVEIPYMKMKLQEKESNENVID